MTNPLTAAKAILAGSARGDDHRVVAEAYIETMRTLAGDPPLLRALSDLRAMRETLTRAQAAAKHWRDEALALRAAAEASRNGPAPILLCADSRTPWHHSTRDQATGGMDAATGTARQAPAWKGAAIPLAAAPPGPSTGLPLPADHFGFEPAEDEVANGAPVVRVGQVWQWDDHVPPETIVALWEERRGLGGGRQWAETTRGKMTLAADGRPATPGLWSLVSDVPEAPAITAPTCLLDLAKAEGWPRRRIE